MAYTHPNICILNVLLNRWMNVTMFNTHMTIIVQFDGRYAASESVAIWEGYEFTFRFIRMFVVLIYLWAYSDVITVIAFCYHRIPRSLHRRDAIFVSSGQRRRQSPCIGYSLVHISLSPGVHLYLFLWVTEGKQKNK